MDFNAFLCRFFCGAAAVITRNLSSCQLVTGPVHKGVQLERDWVIRWDYRLS